MPAGPSSCVSLENWSIVAAVVVEGTVVVDTVAAAVAGNVAIVIVRLVVAELELVAASAIGLVAATVAEVVRFDSLSYQFLFYLSLSSL